MNKENMKNIVNEIFAARGKSQKGDVSQHLLNQGFFDKAMPEGLSKRDKNVTGNPIDTLAEFERQNP